MALPTPFQATIVPRMLRSDDHYVSMPKLGFTHLGALESVGETAGDFDDYCSASRRIEEATCDDTQLAEDIAVMMNRAFAYGLAQAAANRAG